MPGLDLDLDAIHSDGEEGGSNVENVDETKANEEAKANKPEEDGAPVETPPADPDPVVSDDKEGDSGETTDPTLIEDIVSRLGYDFGREFENTEDGIIELVQAASDLRFEQEVEAFAQENPVAADFWKYLTAGGDPAKYIQAVAPEVNYLEMTEVDANNETLQERLVRDQMKRSGDSDEMITKAIEDYKAAGILLGESNRALSRLQNIQRTEASNITQQQQAEAERARKERDTYFEDQEKLVLSSKELAGLPITEKDKPDFVKFIRPDSDGISPYMRSIEEMTAEQIAGIQYLAFKKFDVAALIKVKAATSTAQTLEQRLGSSKNVNPRGSTGRERLKGGGTNVGELDLRLPTT